MATIIGTKSTQHDACFALVVDGEVLAVYEEERFNRIKHGFSAQSRALAKLLDDYKLTVSDIDHVTNYVDISLFPFSQYDALAADQTALTAEQRAQLPAEDWFYNAYVGCLMAHGFPREKIVPVRHHLAHVAGVFYPSGLEQAAILSIDGFGEDESILIAKGDGSSIEVLEHNQFPFSLGAIYLAITTHLGWGFGEEGKTMALAAYGEPTYLDQLHELFPVSDNGFIEYRDSDLLAPNSFMVEPIIARYFGDARKKSEPLSQTHKNLAASIQAYTNDVVIRLARSARDITGCNKLIITGGVALNSVANGELMKQNVFEQLFVYPYANDTGTAVGGALWVEHGMLRHPRKLESALSSAYLGADIDLDNVNDVAKRFGLTSRLSDDPAREAAEKIARGEVVGWIQGRSEVGPRALGNRSILGNPALPHIKDTINNKVKKRETWRPFAPSVLAEDTGLYFESEQLLPYMIIVAWVREAWREKLPSITHIDGSARVQSVEEQQNPAYYALLQRLRSLTGIGMVLNTSFNVGGEPIVATAEQAIRDFLTTGMDSLVIGHHVFENKANAINTVYFHPIQYNLPNTATAHGVHLIGHLEGTDIGAFGSLVDELVLRKCQVSYDSEAIDIAALMTNRNQAIPPEWSTQCIKGSTPLLLASGSASDWIFDRYRYAQPRVMALLSSTQADAVQVVSQNGDVTPMSFIKQYRAAMQSIGFSI